MVLATPTLPLPQPTLWLSRSPTERAEAGLWDHREAGGCGIKPGASDQIPCKGTAALLSQTHPVQALRKRPGWAQRNRENQSSLFDLRPREKPSEPGSGHEKTEGAGVAVRGTIPFVQTLVLSVKNNRLGDKIVLSLTPAILGMLIFKSQN